MKKSADLAVVIILTGPNSTFIQVSHDLCLFVCLFVCLFASDNIFFYVYQHIWTLALRLSVCLFACSLGHNYFCECGCALFHFLCHTDTFLHKNNVFGFLRSVFCNIYTKLLHCCITEAGLFACLFVCFSFPIFENNLCRN